MVELALHQEPLHQVDVLLAHAAGAAQRVALGRCSSSSRLYVRVRGGLARLVQANDRDGTEEETPGDRGEGGEDGE